MINQSHSHSDMSSRKYENIKYNGINIDTGQVLVSEYFIMNMKYRVYIARIKYENIMA